MIALATLSVPETMIGAMLLGRMCLKMIERFELPIVCAASTNSRSFSERKLARTILARYIQLVIPMITMITTTLPLNERPNNWIGGILPPKNLAITSSRNSCGMLNIASVKRISRLSIQPP